MRNLPNQDTSSFSCLCFVLRSPLKIINYKLSPYEAWSPMSQWEWVNSQKGQKKTCCLSLTSTVSSYIFLCPLRHSFPRSLLSTWHPLTGYQVLVFSVHSSFLWGLESCLKYQSLKTESGQPILAFIRFLSLGRQTLILYQLLTKDLLQPIQTSLFQCEKFLMPSFPKRNTRT